MYQDPEEAAVQMAEALAAYHGSHPLVLAIARGAVPIGEFVARALEGDFDVALVGRVGAQYNVAYAVGAIDESGMSYLPPTSAVGDAGNAYLERERSSLLRHLRERRHLYTPHRARLTATCRVVIVVDDGILTGMSMIAALRACVAKRRHGWCVPSRWRRRPRWVRYASMRTRWFAWPRRRASAI